MDPEEMMDKEEMEPMMEKMEEEAEKEDDSCCCECCTTKCQIFTVAIFVIIDFCSELFRLVFIGINKYFDPIYLWIHVLIALALLVSVVLVCYYLFARDSKKSRAVVPWAFLISAIACFLFVLWTAVYIFFIYDKDEVYVTSYEDMDRDDDGKPRNRKCDEDGCYGQ